MRIMKFILATVVVLGASVSMADQVCTHNSQVGLYDGTKTAASVAPVVQIPVGQTSIGSQ